MIFEAGGGTEAAAEVGNDPFGTGGEHFCHFVGAVLCGSGKRSEHVKNERWVCANAIMRNAMDATNATNAADATDAADAADAIM